MKEISEKENKRIDWIDIAKCIGIFAIVYGHTIQTGMTNRYVYSFHVPLFFFLIGVTFSVTRVGEKRPFNFLKSKVLTLLVPYYCFAVVSTLAIFVATRFISTPEAEIFSSFDTLILNVLIGDCDSNSPLWFLPCTFVLSIIGFCIVILSKRVSNRFLKICIFAAFLALGCISLWLTEEFTEIKFLVYKIDGALHMLPFFIVGYAMNEFSLFEKISKISVYLRVFLTLALILLGGVLGILNETSVYLGNYYDNIWLMYISALFTGVGICLLAQLLPKFPPLLYIGRHTMAILLMHKFPILLFYELIPITKRLLKEECVPIGLFVMIISVLLCLAVERLILLVCPFVIGKNRKQKI